MKFVRKWIKVDSGAVAIEFSLIALILICSLFAVVEFGRVVHTRNMLDYLASYLVRSALVTNHGVAGDLNALRSALSNELSVHTVGLSASRLRFELQSSSDYSRVILEYQMPIIVPTLNNRSIVLTAERVFTSR